MKLRWLLLHLLLLPFGSIKSLAQSSRPPCTSTRFLVLESAYQGCLAHELKKRGFELATQVGLPVVFDGEKIELGYRIDLVVENLVIVEIKSVDTFHPVHQAQLLSYMRLSGIGVGLLINFYVTHLRDGIKRMVDGKNWEK